MKDLKILEIAALLLAITLTTLSAGCESDDSGPTGPTSVTPPPPSEPSGRGCVEEVNNFVGRTQGGLPAWDIRLHNTCGFQVWVNAKANAYRSSDSGLIGRGDVPNAYYEAGETAWLCSDKNETASPGHPFHGVGCGFDTLYGVLTTLSYDGAFTVYWNYRSCNARREGDCPRDDLPEPGP